MLAAYIREKCHIEYWLIGLMSVLIEEVGVEKVRDALAIATPKEDPTP